MTSRKTLVIGLAVVALGASAFIATRTSPATGPRRELPVAERRSSSRPPPGPPAVRSGYRSGRDLNSLPEVMRRDFDMQAKGYNAGREGMAAMLAMLGTVKGAGERESFLRGAFTRAASLDVAEAMRWAWQIPPGTDRNIALLTLLCNWSGKSAVEALRGSNDIAATLCTYLLRDHRATPEQVAAFTYDFAHKGFQASLIAMAAIELAATDPARAFALGDALGNNRRDFLEQFAKGWAARDPQAVLNWAGQLPDLQSRHKVQGIVLAALGKRDPSSAAEYLAASLLQGEARTVEIEKLGTSWAAMDTKAALRWADGLPDVEDRAAAVKGIRISAPVGIGVAISGSSAEGFVVSMVVPGSPASREGGLMQGDKIIAVTDMNGNWLQASDFDLMEFLGHIRGEPDTKVVVQVVGKDGGKPRTVPLTREQLTPP